MKNPYFDFSQIPNYTDEEGEYVIKYTDEVNEEFDRVAVEKTQYIHEEENRIDLSKTVYLITWCPDPKELADVDFYLQHNSCVAFLSTYLKGCACGVFCVESTQQGIPHYHGWYQIADYKEKGRIAAMKWLKRYGRMEINEAKHVKIFRWSNNKNALWYYKKDLLGSMINMDPNPILNNTESTVNWDAVRLADFLTFRGNHQSLDDFQRDAHVAKLFYNDTTSYVTTH